LLEKYVTHDDWNAIGRQVRSKIDPLFMLEFEFEANDFEHLSSEQWRKECALKEEYKNLFKNIMQTERGVPIGATARAKESRNSSRLAL